MTRSTRLIAVAAVVLAALLALSAYLRSWGGVALVALGAAAFAWYRVQVAKGAEDDAFFGDAGEDTRLTSFQAGSPSEMPVDRGGTRPGPLAREDDRR
ncbi:hypothetical protein [Ramlibacter pallidus]|uniref:Uncharacterized protein n=1 Tax=Ramlibacter pallidus TaxID=2780087 RepID=A0ABR9S7S8_9BURK|nr:hypothetical protein [Ramlibacter pallidus]MBE7369595.1 hypothetical protein [Ramlibacter pallidus]